MTVMEVILQNNDIIKKLIDKKTISAIIKDRKAMIRTRLLIRVLKRVWDGGNQINKINNYYL